METLKVINGSLKLYRTIKELPIFRSNLLNKFMAQYHGVGDDLDSVGVHYANFDTQIAAKDWEALRQERINLQYCYHLMLNDVDLKSRALLCFVHSIDDMVVGDLLDDDEANKCLKALYETGITVGEAEFIFDEIKKKWMGN